MKVWFFVLILLMASSLVFAQDISAKREQFRQLVADLQKSPDDEALRVRIIQLALTLDPKPATPDAAERSMVRGTAAIKEASSERDFRAAALEFENATLIAPWLANAYYNLAIAQSKAGYYGDAARSLRLYLLAAPEATDAREAKTMMYQMEYKQEKEDATRRVAAWHKQLQEMRHAGLVATNPINMEFVFVAAGTFMMGSEDCGMPTLPEYCHEKPLHRVTIGNGFFLGKYEVTQEQWQKITGKNPSPLKGVDLPVENLSWDDAQEFIRGLNEMDDGATYRLPTDAEWEYACRAGATADDVVDLASIAWYEKNSVDAAHEYGRSHPVGQKRPNAFGLYDMLGNVIEWCEDWSHDNYYEAPADGSAWLRGGEQKFRVQRGGYWGSSAYYLHPWNRSGATPSYHGNPGYGLRLVAVPAAQYFSTLSQHFKTLSGLKSLVR